LDSKTVEAYLDIDPDTDVGAVTDLFAQRLGFNEYEVTAVEWLRIPPREQPSRSEPVVRAQPETATRTAMAPLMRVHPGVITQVLVRPGGRALSVQVRHRRNEVVARVTVKESDEAVAIHASVGTPEGDGNADYTSFAVTFSWVGKELDRPLDARRIIHTEVRDTCDGFDRPSAVHYPPMQPVSSTIDEQPKARQG
jgi:hypothetical protein